MKKILALNGSPRRKGNTATLLAKAVEGAIGAGAAAETVNLYDLTYKGCISCFRCKSVDGGDRGICYYRDELTPVLEKAAGCDLLLMGSPIYLGDVTGMMRSFMERFIFSSLSYQTGGSVLSHPIDVGFIYTMNMPEQMAEVSGYGAIFAQHEAFSGLLSGRWESLAAYDTYQFSDYSKYLGGLFDPEHKKQVHERQFPKDCEAAYQMGRRLAAEVE